MNVLSVAILLLGLAVAFLFGVYGPKRSMPLSLLLYGWHSVLCVAYYQVASASFDPDSMKYFLAAGTHAPFSFGTDGISWIVSILYDAAAAFNITVTYLDYFLIFNIVGYIGVSVLLEVLYRLAGGDRLLQRIAVVTMLLPGVGFWTSALGKDAIVFTGVAVMVFASINPVRRWAYLALGYGLIAFARPYMLAVAAAAFTLQLLLNSRIRLLPRILGGLAVVAGGVLAGPFILHYVALDNLSIEGISSYVATRQSYNIEGGGAADISSYNLVERVFTYLYRPLFFDAQSALGLLASIENLILLAITASALFIGRNQWRKLLSTPAGVYNVGFAAFGLLMEANVTSNLGIALRQKTMILPSIFLILILLMRYARRARMERRRAARPLRERPDLRSPGAAVTQ